MNKTRQILLGLFFLITLSILTIYTLFGTDTVSLFSEPLQLKVYFPEAIGLREGDPVQAVGVRVGRVRELEIDITAPVRERVLATLNLSQELELTEGATIVIEESTLLGGRHVFIDPGAPGGQPLAVGGEIIYGHIRKNPIDGLTEVGDLFAENREAIGDIISSIQSVVGDIEAGRGLVGRLLTNEQVADDLALTLSNLSDATARINAGEGLLGALISDPQLASDARSIVERINAIAGDVKDGQGVVGKLLYDQALANEVQSAVTSFSNIGQKIDGGEGLIGRLVTDQGTADEFGTALSKLAQASDDFAAISSQLRSGQGTLGKLFMDQELYDEVLLTVKLLTRSLEDYRESAPVSAFTSVLFSGF